MGYIVEEDFGLMLFPFLKMRPVRLDQSSPYNDFYKLGVVTRPDNEHEVNVEFYRIPSSALPVPLPEANRPVDNQVTQRSRNSKYHILNQEFDFIQIKINGIVTYAATIMPDWSLASKDLGNLSFDVAIDFGTSNTYVAYRQAGANAVSFDIKETEIQLVRLDKPVQSRSGGGITKKYENLEMGSLILGVLTRIQRDEVTPSVMGIEASGYNMPFQTAVAEAGYITNAQQINLANSNIPFAFGKHYQSTDVKIHTGIKWNNPKPATFDEKRINVFFETLLYMIRTKILLNGGNPAQSRLIWFKPLSMSNFQIQNLSRQWSSLYRRIFDSITAPICITESEAPYYIHSATGRFGGNEPVLSMDIGGGTTDVLLFYNDQPLYSTSSLMASRVLFGEFRNRTFQKNNPILKYYRPMIKELIEAFISNGQTDDLKDAGGQMKSLHEWYFNSSSTTRSEDVISFYFSRPELQFADHLRNEKSPFKVVFLFYLGALHYHYAHYIRYLNLPAPRHICMSGNGSRILNLIDPVPDANNSPVSRFITEIYKKAFTNGINFTIKVHTTPQPKEATAQGGLWKEQKQINQEAQAKILVGEKLYDVYNNMVTDEQVINNLTYQNFQDGPQKLSFKAQNSNYYEFVDFFLGELNKRINYKANFGVIVNLDDLYPILKDDSLVEADFNAGMFNRLELADVQDTLYETVFFYPVMGAISRLSEYLAEKYPDNK
ncbi:MAG: hypothetical protein INR73_03125 [Williamsia sp.]|nr:hypothetical protein [Williamsia sp.]